jgi:hypothetical protein
MISQLNYTSNLTETIYNKVKDIVGSSYTHPSLGSKTITYIGAYPPDITIYKNLLPIIIIDRSNRNTPAPLEQGGRRKYSDTFYIDIIAGGYNDEFANAFMKNAIVDLIVFGFDEKRYDLMDYATNTVQGQYQANCREIPRVPTSSSSIYEMHHAQIALSVWTAIKN